ncbi:DUF2812 domain-containing protein [Oscillospiraceae bacterium PP1C4]
MKKKIEWLSVFRYVVPADFEHFMESLALEGWNVEKVGQWSSVKMDFVKTSPKKYSYVFDINVFPKKDYKATYEEFGWEFVGQMASCFLWRKEYTDERPESFTDAESTERRNRNIRNAVMVSSVLFSAVLLILVFLFMLTLHKLDLGDIVQFLLGIVMSGSFSVYLWWVVRKIQKNINR